MVSFVHKKISDEGELTNLLKNARAQAGLTLEKAEKLSLVAKKYLIALEEGQYWELPGPVYGRQFLKAYLKFLPVNADILLEKFDSEYKVAQNWQERSQKVKSEVPKRVPKMVIGPWFLKKAAVFLVILAFASYLGWEIKHIMEPPELVIDSPSDNLVTSRQVVEIKGWVEPESKLSINGQEVYSDRTGNFNELVGLQPGVNLINFTAKKKYSREKALVRKVMVKQDEEISRALINNN